MEAHIVLCELYTKSLYRMYINFGLQGINYHTIQNYLTTELVGVLVTICESSLFYSVPPVKFEENFFIRPQLLPSKSSPIHHSVIILTIDPTWSELLTASVHKSQKCYLTNLVAKVLLNTPRNKPLYCCSWHTTNFLISSYSWAACILSDLSISRPSRFFNCGSVTITYFL